MKSTVVWYGPVQRCTVRPGAELCERVLLFERVLEYLQTHAGLCSFEIVCREKNHFKKFHWRYFVIDEAHR